MSISRLQSQPSGASSAKDSADWLEGALWQADPPDIHPGLAHVRNLPEFAATPPDLGGSWLDLPQLAGFRQALKDLQRWLSDGLDAILSQLRPDLMPAPRGDALPHIATQLLSWGISLVLALTLLAIGYLALSSYLRRRKPAAAPALNAQVDGQLLLTSDAHRARALAFESEGRRAEAVREVYLASLCLLSERRWVPFDEAKTNAEYGEALGYRLTPDLAPRADFMRVADLFEHSRYGRRPVPETGVSACLSALERLAATSQDRRELLEDAD